MLRGMSVLLSLVVLSAVHCSPQQGAGYDPRLSPVELSIIKTIVDSLPGAAKWGRSGPGGATVVASVAREIQAQPAGGVAQVSGDADERPDDQTLIRIVSGHYAGDAQPEAHLVVNDGDDVYTIDRSISTELHLDQEVVDLHASPPSGGGDPDEGRTSQQYVPPEENIDIRNYDIPTGAQRQYNNNGGSGFMKDSAAAENSPETKQQNRNEFSGTRGEKFMYAQNSAGNGFTKFFASPEPTNSQQTFNGGSGNEFSAMQGRSVAANVDDEDKRIGGNYNVVPELSRELEPTENEFDKDAAQLRSMNPPPPEGLGDVTPGFWTEVPLDDDIVPSTRSDDGISADCQTGHKLIKGDCKKVYTFQLKGRAKRFYFEKQ